MTICLLPPIAMVALATDPTLVYQMLDDVDPEVDQSYDLEQAARHDFNALLGDLCANDRRIMEALLTFPATELAGRGFALRLDPTMGLNVLLPQHGERPFFLASDDQIDRRLVNGYSSCIEGQYVTEANVQVNLSVYWHWENHQVTFTAYARIPEIHGYAPDPIEGRSSQELLEYVDTVLDRAKRLEAGDATIQAALLPVPLPAEIL